MTRVQKKIAWAVGLTTLLAGGIALAASGSSAGGSGPGGPVAPPASDADVDAVANKALAIETDPDLLRQLARAMLIFPYSNPLRSKVAMLQARADQIEANRSPSAQQVSSGTMTLAQAALAAKNG